MKNFFCDTNIEDNKNRLLMNEAIKLAFNIQQAILAYPLVELNEVVKNPQVLIDKLDTIDDKDDYNNVADIVNQDFQAISSVVTRQFNNYTEEVFDKKIVDYSVQELNDTIQQNIDKLEKQMAQISQTFNATENEFINLMTSDDLEDYQFVASNTMLQSKYNNLRFSDFPKTLAHTFINLIMTNNAFGHFEEFVENPTRELTKNKILDLFDNSFDTLNDNLDLSVFDDNEKQLIKSQVKTRCFQETHLINACRIVFKEEYSQFHEFEEDFLKEFGKKIQNILIDEIENAIIILDNEYIDYLLDKDFNLEEIIINTVEKTKRNEYEKQS